MTTRVLSPVRCCWVFGITVMGVEIKPRPLASQMYLYSFNSFVRMVQESIRDKHTRKHSYSFNSLINMCSNVFGGKRALLTGAQDTGLCLVQSPVLLLFQLLVCCVTYSSGNIQFKYTYTKINNLIAKPFSYLPRFSRIPKLILP